MIEIKHLKTIQTLAKTGSVVATAHALHMTQSALSHQIKQLENLLGLSLFVRKSSPLIWTEAGKILLTTANDILPRLIQTEHRLKSLEQGQTGRLWIGVECHTCFEWLMPMVRSYQQEWPGVDLDIVNSLANINQFSELTALKNLKKQRLDLVITSDPNQDPALCFTPLFSYELVVVSAISNPLNNKPWLEAEDFATETLIHYPVDESKLDIYQQFLTPNRVKPKHKRLSEMTLMMLQLVEGQKGICVLPKWLLQTLPDYSELPTSRIGKNGLWSTLYSAVRKEDQSLPYLNQFQNKVIERFKSL
ncbi:MAG TPA: LysR family transcriptional regulator [Thiomicrospira sp.]|jgi:LysR family transcriptional regulator for metE and metH|nr:LysR family transcriptional regulator [Thiomicrospira sp.]